MYQYFEWMQSCETSTASLDPSRQRIAAQKLPMFNLELLNIHQNNTPARISQASPVCLCAQKTMCVPHETSPAEARGGCRQSNDDDDCIQRVNANSQAQAVKSRARAPTITQLRAKINK